MRPLYAEIVTEITDGQTDRRGATRRTLRLGVPAYLDEQASPATINDLSETGLMIQTSASLKVDDHFEVELPEVGRIGARVVWQMDDRFGCQFDEPVPKSAISASLLLAQPAAGSAQEAGREEDDADPGHARAERRPYSVPETEASVLLLLAAMLRFLLALAVLPILFLTSDH